MNTDEKLLTVVIEATDSLDRESLTYRRLLAARLKWESYFDIQVVNSPLTTIELKEFSSSRPSKYIVIIDQGHQISADFLPKMLAYLRSKTVYLAEPFRYTGAIPTNPAATKVDNAYHFRQDIDLHGVAFHTGRLADALDTLGDLDRTSLYLAYRLYWAIGEVTPIATGYSITSDTKTAIGYSPSVPLHRLLPLISTGSGSLRVRILHQLVLFLRGLRESRTTSIDLDHLRDLVTTYALDKLLGLAEHMHSFECAWISWLADPTSGSQLFKQLSAVDAHLVFTTTETWPEPQSSIGTAELGRSDVVLQRIAFADQILTIGKTYRPRALRPELVSPAHYDFYRQPVTKDSILLFFDRPLQADDNAEYLYAHFTAAHPEFTRTYFALNPKSPDWDRLEARGFRLVPFFSTEFYELFLRSDLVIASQIYNLRYKGKTLANSRFVYLQHGVQLNDMSNWVASKHFDVFVATGKVEADYLSAIAPLETINSGLPRLQTLRGSGGDSRKLLFMPTWRFNLHQASPEQFRRSHYFQAIQNLLTDRRLLEHLEVTNTTLNVKLHPNVEKRAENFTFSPHVVLSDESYREAISTSDFVFTDYSSAVIDAAFVSTPIAYYQWDTDDFFSEQPYESRLDYNTDGLGPVFTDHTDLIDHIVSGGYKEPAQTYAQRREHFFEGVDIDRINDTIIERMLSL